MYNLKPNWEFWMIKTKFLACNRCKCNMYVTTMNNCCIYNVHVMKSTMCVKFSLSLYIYILVFLPRASVQFFYFPRRYLFNFIWLDKIRMYLCLTKKKNKTLKIFIAYMVGCFISGYVEFIAGNAHTQMNAHTLKANRYY